MLKFTNPNKILYPEDKITKQELAEFLLSVKHLMLPYIQNRLLSIVRCPEGYKKECFFQKHLIQKNIPGIGKKTIHNTTRSHPFFYLKNEKGVLYFAQMSALEIHPWGSHIQKLEKPDIVLFDLDPSPSVEWKTTIHLAHFMRKELEKLNLKSFVKTTGGKGLHLVVPIEPKYSWDKVKIFAHSFASYIVQHHPKLCTDNIGKSHRRGKIFIDYLRNTRGATAVAPYSHRARRGAPVSTPLAWDELNGQIKSNYYNIQNFHKRLKQIENSDPWAELYQIKQFLKLE